MLKERFIKMAKITKIQQYAVLWLSSQSLDNQAIATETNISIKQVDNIINKFTVDNSKSQINTTSGPAKVPSKTKQLMITESVGGRQNVAIMTKEASQVADEERKKFEPLAKKDTSHIFRPNT
jgi:transposase